jgi:hypothetical protein
VNASTVKLLTTFTPKNTKMKSTNLIPRRVRESLSDVGIGGWDCPCCRPPKKEIDKLNKLIRHKLKDELNKELKESDPEE